MKKKTIQKRKLHRECWNLDYTFIVWLNEHLKAYLHDAAKIVNLEYHKFEYCGKEYTQKQIIERMIELSDWLKDSDWLEKDFDTKVNELLDLWKLVFPAMWW